jgi:hypothetical protein
MHSGDGAGQRGLAHAGGAHQAEDGALEVLDEAVHGEVLEDALFGLLQAVVIGFEHRFGGVEVGLVLGDVEPGQEMIQSM